MKKFITFLLLLFSAISFAQMDTEHWFAPMKSNYPSGNTNYQAVYLSTSEAQPFDVQIYSGGTVIGTVSLKKGSPQIFEIPRQNIITEDPSDCMTVLQQKGIHLVGPKKYFATLRISVPNHAEIVTSKGKAALGKEFFIGTPKVNNAGANSNYIASILATENGTSIKLSGYNSTLIFTNGATPTPVKSITLNKGEAYIFEVDEGTNIGLNGLLGAKIDSDKPITVSNGSFSGRISDYGVDIFMDQAVPVEKTGREFIVVGGNGDFPNSAIESSLIVATNDNTEVYLNNETTPYRTLPKAGDFVFVPSNKYRALDPANNIYALYVKTTENVYVYEILAGTSDQEKPSGGMNLIPALSCFLPSKIDEISDVNHLPLTAANIGYKETHDVKLNILAQKNSAVTVNGSTAGLLGPFPLAGSADWEVYSKPGVSGNQTIATSNDKAITAGIAGGSGPAGFGGYFAGFSSVPAISKTGDCATRQLLEVDDFYDDYEWFYSTDNINWTSLPHKTYSINPGTKFGYYKVTVTKLSCSPPKTTKEFKYLKCPFKSTKVFNIGACKSFFIDPAFSKNPLLKIDPLKTAVISRPAGGKAYVGTDGRIYFNAENTTEEQVQFTYYLEELDREFPEYEEVTVTVNITQIKTADTEITECIDYSGKGFYNLKKSFEPANQDPGFITYEYYTDASFSAASKISDSEIEHYYSVPNITVYVKITNNSGCTNHLNPAKIFLKTYELPEIKFIDVKGRTSAVIQIEKGSKPYYVAVKKGKLTNNHLPADSEYTEFLTGTAEVAISEGKGYYTVFVKSADNCLPVISYFSVVGLSNVITPNGDGLNEKIDLSTLTAKLNPVFRVFDRFGKMIFEGSTANSFIWEGLTGGFSLPTGTYWYYVQWQDYPEAAPDQLQGWILLKNR